MILDQGRQVQNAGLVTEMSRDLDSSLDHPDCRFLNCLSFEHLFDQFTFVQAVAPDQFYIASSLVKTI